MAVADNEVLQRLQAARAPLLAALVVRARAAALGADAAHKLLASIASIPRPRAVVDGLGGAITFARFSADGRRAAVGNLGGAVVIDRRGAELARIANEGLVDAHLDARGKRLLTLHDDGHIALRPVGDGKVTRLGDARPPQPGNGWVGAAFAPDGRTAVVATRASVFRVTLDGSAPPREELLGEATIRQVLRTPAGLRVVATADNVMRLWSWRKGKARDRFIDRIQFSDKRRRLLDARLSGDGKLLVTADVGPDPRAPAGTRLRVAITVWHRKPNGYWWNQRAKFLRQPDNGRVAATVAIAADGATAIADVERLGPPAKGHTTWFFAQTDWRRTRKPAAPIALSASGRDLLDTDAEGLPLLVSDVGGKASLAGTKATRAAFSGDGKWLLTGHQDGSARLLELPPGARQHLGRIPGTGAERLTKTIAALRLPRHSCLSADQRQRWLGEDPAKAKAAAQVCFGGK